MFRLEGVMTQMVDPSLAQVGFVVDKVAVGQVFPPVRQFPLFQNHSINAPQSSHSHVALIGRTSGGNLVPLQKAILFRKPLSIGYESVAVILC